MLNHSEKRAARRIPVELPIEYTIHGDDDLYFGHCRNLSVDGIAFSTNEELDPGAIIELTLFTADEELFAPLRARINILRRTPIGEDEFEVAGRIETVLD